MSVKEETMPGYAEADFRFWESLDFMIVDLDSESVSFVSENVVSGYNDDNTYKTNKILLKRIYSGEYKRGSPSDELGRDPLNENQYTNILTEDFYIGVFEITQAQWEKVMGDNPSWFTNSLDKTRPVEYLSYEDIRGSDLGTNYPVNVLVDEDSFLGVLRGWAEIDFDLPTEAQWEYACRAGTSGAWNNGTTITDKIRDANLDLLARYYPSGVVGGYTRNSTTARGTSAVGAYLPNSYGLYDMHGNVWEWCRDRHEVTNNVVSIEDYSGGLESLYRVIKGGAWGYPALFCRSAYRSAVPSASRNTYDGMGFRLYAPKVYTVVAQKYGITRQIIVVHGTGGGYYPPGTPVEIAANLSAGTSFSHWSADSSVDLGSFYNTNASPTIILTPEANIVLTMTPNLVPTFFDCIYLANGGGVITGVSTQSCAYGTDSSVVVAEAFPGYTFSGWSDGGTETNRYETGIMSNQIYYAYFTKDIIGFAGYVPATNVIEGTTVEIPFEITQRPSSNFVVSVTKFGDADLINTEDEILIDVDNWNIPYAFSVTAIDNPLNTSNSVAWFVLSTGDSNVTVTVTETDIDFVVNVGRYPSGSINFGSIYKYPNKTIFRTDDSLFLNATAFSGYVFEGWANATNDTPVLDNPTNVVISVIQTNIYAFFDYATISMSFKTNETMVLDTTVNCTYKQPIPSLPVPEENLPYVFGGWFTGTNGTGAVVSEGLISWFKTNTTVHAYFAEP